MSERWDTTTTGAFYEEYPFPGSRPIDQDGLIFLRMFGKSLQRHATTTPLRTMRVLDAGCGTGNTSIALARHFPSIIVVGIDQSDASLKHARAAAATLGVKNVSFHTRDLLKPLPRNRKFDVVLCLGVLHHLQDMNRGLMNLQNVLKYDGELYLWLYGRYGRYLHSLNMQLLNLLRSASEPKTDPVQQVRDLIGHPGNEAMMKDLLGIMDASALRERAFSDPVWLADQFLNPHESLLSIGQVLRLVKRCGLAVDRIVGMDGPAAIHRLPPSLQGVFRRLSPPRRLLALDLLMKPERYFLHCRKLDSPGES